MGAGEPKADGHGAAVANARAVPAGAERRGLEGSAMVISSLTVNQCARSLGGGVRTSEKLARHRGALKCTSGSHPESLVAIFMPSFIRGRVVDVQGASLKTTRLVLCRGSTPGVGAVQNTSLSPAFNRLTQEAIMTALITLADLNTAINHEPRVLDALIAERLGFSRPRDVRKIIERSKAELETYGTLTIKNGRYRGQPTSEYWLNEAQALLLCCFSRTEKAAEVRKALIEVYQEYRNRRSLPAVTQVASYARRAKGERPLEESLKHDGMGLIQLNGTIYLFDMRQNCLPEGGEVIGLLDKELSPVTLRPIDDDEQIGRHEGYMPWEQDKECSHARTSRKPYVLGRIIGKRAVNALRRIGGAS